MGRQPKNLAVAKNQVQANHLFMRRLHSRRTLRQGLAIARKATNPQFLPEIVRHLYRSAMYGSLVSSTPFPSSLSDFTEGSRLEQLSTQGEFSWTAGVLSCFTSELNNFVVLRDKFYGAFQRGQLDAAAAELDEIVGTFGHSIWSIDQRIKLLQASGGLKAQKDYLESVISTRGTGFLPGWMAYYSSLRAENTTSPSMLEDVVVEVSDMGIQPVVDYVRSHLATYDLTLIDDPGSPINWEEPHPIIDRFETFISMSLVFLSKTSATTATGLLPLLGSLKIIGDRRISNMIDYLSGSISMDTQEEIGAFDAYTRGDYIGAIKSNGDQIELCARAHAFLGTAPGDLSRGSIRDEAIALMLDVLTENSESTQSASRLKKLALLYSGQDLSSQITGFLERPANYITAPKISNLSKYSVLSTAVFNPLNAWLLDMNGDGHWLENLVKLHPSSPSTLLQRSLEQTNLASLAKIDEIPSSRRLMYAGHIQYGLGDYRAASQSYRQVALEQDAYASAVAFRYLYDALFAEEKISEALDLLVPHLLENVTRAHVYPLSILASRCMEDANLLYSLPLAVLLHLASRFVDKRWERDLSDVFENIMARYSLERPSDLLQANLEVESSILIYFLRNVCVPRILSDSTTFGSVDAIDLERIAVCQGLLRLDPENSASYLSEIRILTRDGEVAHLLKKIQTSLIYVDEDGLRESLQPTLAPSLSRLQVLMESPDIAYQAEKVSKRLGEMLSHSGKSGDFKSISLPATEIAGLFRSMLVTSVTEFAGSPAYGLDTHLSTSIRHGAFEGELRSPLAVENLLCIRSETSTWLATRWHDHLSGLTALDIDHVDKQIQRFTEKFEDIIQVYLKEKLHVRLVGGSPLAMFNFETKPAQERSLLDSITTETDYAALMDKLLAFCWQLTSASLDAVRLDLSNHLAHSMNLAFDVLVRGVESKVSHEKVGDLVDAIARARTGFQVALANVSSWFQLPSDLSREPFDFDLAARIALQQVNNCNIATPLRVSFDIHIQDKLDGTLLDGVCEILFILFQNVILRSGLDRCQMAAKLDISMHCGDITIECRNQLDSSLNLAEVAAQAQEAAACYDRDSALKAARKEGGSGLSKVWRICEFDLKKESQIELSVSDNWFAAKLVLKQLGLSLCAST